MVRDVNDDKTDYTLVLDGPMFERWAEQLTRGGRKYDKRNWLQAEGPDELSRFRESALRHFIQWFRGDTDEDHAAAVFFNVNGAEYVKGRASGQGLWYDVDPKWANNYFVHTPLPADPLPADPYRFVFTTPTRALLYDSGCPCSDCTAETKARDAASSR